MRLVKKLSIILTSTLVGAVLFGAVASAQSSGGMGGRPVNPDPNNPRTQSIFIFTLDKGQSDSDTILLSNNSGETKTVELYAVDGIVTNTGSYTCSQQVEAKEGVGEWIRLDQDAVTLEAGQTTEVDFQLTLPEAVDVGEHNGCIVFQEKASEGTVEGNVRVLTRQAIRVAVTVPGDLRREVTITEFTTGSLRSNPSFTLKITNRGNVSADVDAQVRLTNVFGGVVFQNGGGYPVLANKQLELTFVNENRPFFGGWYYASASVAYDKRADTFGTQDSANLITEQTDKQLIFVTPTPLGAAVITLLVLGGIYATVHFIVRRRNQANLGKNWVNYTVKKNDDIQNLATQAGVHWKKIASVNQLSAPYVLKKGQKIKLPEIAATTVERSKKKSKS